MNQQFLSPHEAVARYRTAGLTEEQLVLRAKLEPQALLPCVYVSRRPALGVVFRNEREMVAVGRYWISGLFAIAHFQTERIEQASAFYLSFLRPIRLSVTTPSNLGKPNWHPATWELHHVRDWQPSAVNAMDREVHYVPEMIEAIGTPTRGFLETSTLPPAILAELQDFHRTRETPDDGIVYKMDHRRFTWADMRFASNLLDSLYSPKAQAKSEAACEPNQLQSPREAAEPGCPNSNEEIIAAHVAGSAWTQEERAALRALRDQHRQAGHADYAERVANLAGISTSRLRGLIGGAEEGASKARKGAATPSSWPRVRKH